MKPRIIRYKPRKPLLERVGNWLAVVAVIGFIALSAYSLHYAKQEHGYTQKDVSALNALIDRMTINERGVMLINELYGNAY
jgi:hypothetical protein